MEDTTSARDPARAGAGRRAPSLGPVPLWFLIFSLLVIDVGIAGSRITFDEHLIGPGETRDMLDEISISQRTVYPSEGQMLLTTAAVSTERINVWDKVWSWLDPDLDTIPRSQVFPTDIPEQQRAQDRADIEQSKVAAAVAAYRAIGLPVTRLPGARVHAIEDGTPADGALRVRDRIVAVDGSEAADPARIGALLRDRRPGDEVTLTVVRKAAPLDVTIRTVPTREDRRMPRIGVFLGDAFDVEETVRIDTGEVGGPSGGLAFALALADLFTREDLTRGHVVGVTGTITVPEEGPAIVGEVARVKDKVRGALRAGADVFIVPKEPPRLHNEALEAAPESMTVIAVATLEEAVAALRRLPPKRPGGG